MTLVDYCHFYYNNCGYDYYYSKIIIVNNNIINNEINHNNKINKF